MGCDDGSFSIGDRGGREVVQKSACARGVDWEGIRCGVRFVGD